MTSNQQQLKNYADFFENLRVDDLPGFDRLFHQDVHFKDPFNDVHGLDAVKQVFTHMFEQCDNPRFTVSDHCGTGDRGYLQWSFSFTPKGRAEVSRLEGLSRVIFDAEGRVLEHIDYWDPAEQIYSQLPILGWVLNLVRGRLSAMG